MNKESLRVFAVLNRHAGVCWTKGGSSTKSRLMCYHDESSAKKGLAIQSRRQNMDGCYVMCIFTVNRNYERDA